MVGTNYKSGSKIGVRSIALVPGEFNFEEAMKVGWGFSHSADLDLLLMMIEDPYMREQIIAHKDMWIMLADRLGISIMDPEILFIRGHVDFDDGLFRIGGEAGLFRGGAEADWGLLKAEGLLELLAASGFFISGQNSDFSGSKGAFRIVVLDCGGKVILGPRDFNGRAGVQGVVGELSGSYRAYRRGDGSFSLGARGNLTAAEMGSIVQLGSFPFASQGFDNMGNPKVTERYLSSLSVKGGYGVGVGGGLGVQSETVTVQSAGLFGINALTFDGKGKIPNTPVSADVEFTIPSPNATVFGFTFPNDLIALADFR